MPEPRNKSATIAMIPIRARINAYSASPCPVASWSTRSRNHWSHRWSIADGFPFRPVVAHGPERRRTAGAGSASAVLKSAEGSRGLDGRADLVKDRADRAAEENQGDDRDDGDEGEDQRVLRETLAFLVTIEKSDKGVKHLDSYLLSSREPPNRLPPSRES